MLTEPAHAKINLTLHVTGNRPDGYHLLDSLVVFAGAHDTIAAEPSPTLSLTLAGRFAPGLEADGNNLVLRAARALAEATATNQGAALTLTKNLPVASGIGGGSSDAAATLRVLAKLWNVSLSKSALNALATQLGADVPVCLAPAPRRMQGIGEILLPAPEIPPCGILLANPGLAVSTQAVFRARPPSFSQPSTWPAAWPTAHAMASDLAADTNDLQASAEALCPAITTTLQTLSALPGALLVRMSGSGATCFALFPTPTQAQQAAATLQHPGWWCWGGPLYEPAAAP